MDVTVGQGLCIASLSIFILEALFFIYLRAKIPVLLAESEDEISQQLQQFFLHLKPSVTALYVGIYSLCLLIAFFWTWFFGIIFFIQFISVVCDLLLGLYILKRQS